ncbi:MAG: dihydropteroate synthase [Gemmatimonadales bacterium]
MKRRSILLGLGSSLGDRAATLRRTLRTLAADGPGELLGWSRVYESEALLPEGAPESWDRPYLNLAALIATTAEPVEVLRACKKLELALGRAPAERWAPRAIDIDLLADQAVVRADGELRLPHPGLATRPFALLPAADLAPSWVLETPDGNATLADLASPWRIPGTAPFDTRPVAVPTTDLVGVLNLTPDSFSDGGKWHGAGAVAHAVELVRSGASAIDLGAESTRPGASTVSADEEWARLGPVLAALRQRWPRGEGVVLSVDTRHPTTAERVLAAGADWLNDVTGFADDRMVAVAAGSGCDLVAMHSLEVPPGRLTLDPGRDPIGQLLDWGEATLRRLEAAGIARRRIVFDPGIGFGKTPEQTRVLLERAHELRTLGVRVLIGHSRKSVLAKWLPERGAVAADRDPETHAVSQQLASRSVDYLRVHDVGGSALSLAMGGLLNDRPAWTGRG